MEAQKAQAKYVLVPLTDEGKELEYGDSLRIFIDQEDMIIGRNTAHRITDRRISRKQIQLSTLGLKEGVSVTMVKCFTNAIRSYFSITKPNSGPFSFQGGTNATLIRKANGQDIYLRKTGESHVILPGDVVYVVVGLHPFKLQSSTTSQSATATNSVTKKKRKLGDSEERESEEWEDLGEKEEAKATQEWDWDQESSPKKLKPDPKGDERPSWDWDEPNAHKRHHQSSPAKKVAPLAFHFGENGASVQVIEIGDDDEDQGRREEEEMREKVAKVLEILPDLPEETVREALVSAGGKLAVVLSMFLGIDPRIDEEDDRKTNERDKFLEDIQEMAEREEELAGPLVDDNRFLEPEPYFHLNSLPNFPDSANNGALRIRELIPVLQFHALRATQLTQALFRVQESVEKAIITTYEIDMVTSSPQQTHTLIYNWMKKQEWLLLRCPVLQRIQWTCIHGEQDDFFSQAGLPKNIRVHKPRLPMSYGVHHTKLMLLFFKDRLRVIVSTANLIPKDYEKKTQVKE